MVKVLEQDEYESPVRGIRVKRTTMTVEETMRVSSPPKFPLLRTEIRERKERSKKKKKTKVAKKKKEKMTDGGLIPFVLVRYPL